MKALTFALASVTALLAIATVGSFLAGIWFADERWIHTGFLALMSGLAVGGLTATVDTK